MRFRSGFVCRFFALLATRQHHSCKEVSMNSLRQHVGRTRLRVRPIPLRAGVPDSFLGCEPVSIRCWVPIIASCPNMRSLPSPPQEAIS